MRDYHANVEKKRHYQKCIVQFGFGEINKRVGTENGCGEAYMVL